MKICVICLATKGGGMIHYASQLANSLAENNEVYAIISESIEEEKYFGKKVNILQVPIIPKNRISLNWFRVDKMIRLIKNTNPDIIHITVEHPLQIPILFFLKQYPLILTCHDVKVHPGDIKSSFDFLIFLSRQILKRTADKIIVHGAILKEQLIEGGQSANKIAVIPHGDYSFFTKYKKDNIKEENAVLFFGRIREYKGIEYLIKAEPWITKRFYNIKIIIAGRGNFSKYENLIEHKKNFEINNKFIPDEEVAELFQRAKIVALPYIEASQPGIIPIAYAFKKPVVVTDVGSISEVVDNEKTGFIVPSRDEKALADAIMKLLKDDKLRNEMGENAYKKMKEELSWDKIAEKTINVYKEVINEHKNKRRRQITKKYNNYTEYTRYVDFKRLDFIIQSIRKHTNRPKLKLKGFDLGCGKGNVAVPLASFGYRMVAVDISPDNIEAAKSKRITNDNPIFLVGDAVNLKLEGKSFDFAICSALLEHLNHPEKALNAINEILKESGLLIVTVPNGYGPYSFIFDHFRNKIICKIFPPIGLSEHFQAFTLSKISNLLKEAGFEVLDINHSDFLSFLPMLVKSRIFSYYDCKVADKLPSLLVSGYYIACRKK